MENESLSVGFQAHISLLFFFFLIHLPNQKYCDDTMENWYNNKQAFKQYLQEMTLVVMNEIQKSRNKY